MAGKPKPAHKKKVATLRARVTATLRARVERVLRPDYDISDWVRDAIEAHVAAEEKRLGLPAFTYSDLPEIVPIGLPEVEPLLAAESPPPDTPPKPRKKPKPGHDEPPKRAAG